MTSTTADADMFLGPSSYGRSGSPPGAGPERDGLAVDLDGLASDDVGRAKASTVRRARAPICSRTSGGRLSSSVMAAASAWDSPAERHGRSPPSRRVPRLPRARHDTRTGTAHGLETALG